VYHWITTSNIKKYYVNKVSPMSSSIHTISCSSGGFYSGTGSDVYITIYCILDIVIITYC
jgi:hypothetical protein